MSRTFNGTSDIITAPGVGTAVDISSGPMTIVFSIYLTSADMTADHAILGKWSDASGADQQYWIGIGGLGSNDQLGFVVGSYSPILGVYAQSSPNLETGVWYRGVLLVDPAGVVFGSPAVQLQVTSIVANGLVETAFRERRTAGGVNLVFADKTSGTDYFAGKMGQCAIWNTILSAGEVIALQRGVSPAKTRRTNLVGYWTFSGVATPEPDFSGNVLNGVLTGTGIDNQPPVCEF